MVFGGGVGDGGGGLRGTSVLSVGAFVVPHGCSLFVKCWLLLKVWLDIPEEGGGVLVGGWKEGV